ncbi:hypothetical protein PABY_06370 [Pyrodictium abyssi]|uniref:Uncharacterized protein n=1 Tax=Pyrodictium abyssi TaxID=54256 RepID=A0ABM8IU28_9CREN|nr:hypothetical protein PABY_06370 [Pyrodictium abyssi]
MLPATTEETEIVIATQYAVIRIPKSKNSDKIMKRILELLHGKQQLSTQQ